MSLQDNTLTVNNLKVTGDVTIKGKLIVEKDAWVKNELWGNHVLVKAAAKGFVWDMFALSDNDPTWTPIRNNDPDEYDHKAQSFNNIEFKSKRFSDLRLKRNIRPITSALSSVESMRGVRFRWNEEALSKFTRHIENALTGPYQSEEEAAAARSAAREQAREALDIEQVGLIAQEVMEVLPEVVKQDAEGHFGVDYDRIVALLVDAVKGLSQRVEEQAQEIKSLKAAPSTKDL